MEVNELNTTQLYIAGCTIMKLLDELKKEQEMDKDTQKAMKYISKQFEKINAEIAREVILQLHNGFEKIKEDMENE